TQDLCDIEEGRFRAGLLSELSDVPRRNVDGLVNFRWRDLCLLDAILQLQETFRNWVRHALIVHDPTSPAMRHTSTTTPPDWPRRVKRGATDPNRRDAPVAPRVMLGERRQSASALKFRGDRSHH